MAEDSIFESPSKEANIASAQLSHRTQIKKSLISPREYVRLTTNTRVGNERIENYNMTVPFLKPLEKSRAVPFVKDSKKRDYISTVTRESARWIGPNHYTISDSEGFKVDRKLIKFPLFVAKRRTVFEQIAQEKKGIPASSFYTPQVNNKILGSPK